MTSEQANRIIAEAIGKDVIWAWWGREHHRPVDFAYSSVTLRLIEWAAKQGWWGKTNKHGCCCLDSVDGYLTDFTGGDVTLEWVATRIRDLVAEAIQEQSDG